MNEQAWTMEQRQAATEIAATVAFWEERADDRRVALTCAEIAKHAHLFAPLAPVGETPAETDALEELIADARKRHAYEGPHHYTAALAVEAGRRIERAQEQLNRLKSLRTAAARPAVELTALDYELAAAAHEMRRAADAVEDSPEFHGTAEGERIVAGNRHIAGIMERAIMALRTASAAQPVALGAISDVLVDMGSDRTFANLAEARIRDNVLSASAAQTPVSRETLARLVDALERCHGGSVLLSSTVLAEMDAAKALLASPPQAAAQPTYGDVKACREDLVRLWNARDKRPRVLDVDEVLARHWPQAAAQTGYVMGFDPATPGEDRSVERCAKCDHQPGPLLMPKDILLDYKLVWQCECECHGSLASPASGKET